jgi:hypothetical protein
MPLLVLYVTPELIPANPLAVLATPENNYIHRPLRDKQ